MKQRPRRQTDRHETHTDHRAVTSSQQVRLYTLHRLSQRGVAGVWPMETGSSERNRSDIPAHCALFAYWLCHVCSHVFHCVLSYCCVCLPTPVFSPNPSAACVLGAAFSGGHSSSVHARGLVTEQLGVDELLQHHALYHTEGCNTRNWPPKNKQAQLQSDDEVEVDVELDAAADAAAAASQLGGSSSGSSASGSPLPFTLGFVTPYVRFQTNTLCLPPSPLLVSFLPCGWC